MVSDRVMTRALGGLRVRVTVRTHVERPSVVRRQAHLPQAEVAVVVRHAELVTLRVEPHPVHLKTRREGLMLQRGPAHVKGSVVTEGKENKLTTHALPRLTAHTGRDILLSTEFNRFNISIIKS